MAAQIEIRPATPEDAPAIAAILYDAFVEFKSLYTEGGFSATTPNIAQILVRMNEGPAWLAMGNKVALGTVAALVKSQSAYIRGMAVLPSARAFGVGATMLRHVENWAVSQECARLFLSTTPFLSAAIRLYEKFGFRRISEGPHELAGTPLFTMEKKLFGIQFLETQ
ncbi:MAG TPA: GNAT family N-acetyltransferase [Candidatus Dormibacteraeota bacterium]|jgi:N-acetylglutamate synthase-like GNAT family acetyltransferase|nr:GNAT family N-acetyltransferase [Candidatus Dormibacteraeota bacterium]